MNHQDSHADLAALAQRLQAGEALTGAQLLGLLARFYPGYSRPPDPPEDEEEGLPCSASGGDELERLEGRLRQMQALIEDDDEDFLVLAQAVRREGDRAAQDQALERVQTACRLLEEA